MKKLGSFIGSLALVLMGILLNRANSATDIVLSDQSQTNTCSLGAGSNCVVNSSGQKY